MGFICGAKLVIKKLCSKKDLKRNSNNYISISYSSRSVFDNLACVLAVKFTKDVFRIFLRRLRINRLQNLRMTDRDFVKIKISHSYLNINP